MKPLVLIFAFALIFSSCRRDVKDGIRLGEYDKMEEKDSMPNKKMMPDSAAVDTVVVDSSAMDTVRKEAMAE
jgi:hypothetical protein